MSKMVRIRLLKAYMYEPRKIIPRGKVIEVTEEEAVWLERQTPPRAERPDEE